MPRCSSQHTWRFARPPVLRRRVAHARRDQAFGLEAVQCGVKRTWRNIASRPGRPVPLGYFTPDASLRSRRIARRIQLFEFAEIQLQPPFELHCS